MMWSLFPALCVRIKGGSNEKTKPNENNTATTDEGT